MRILVIGGTAFMGREIVRRLAARGHDVAVLHRKPDHDLGPAIRNVQADRADLRAMEKIVEDGSYEAVFDTAFDWEKGTTPQQVEAVARAANRNLHRYVFMSSIAAYLPGLDRKESDPLVPAEFPNPYAVAKAEAERALFRLASKEGLPLVTFRPPFVHGPRQPFYREQFFWDRLLDGRRIILPDDGEGLMQWAYVDDVAEACVRSLEVDDTRGEAFNIGHQRAVTHREFVESLARVAGVTPTLVPMPRETIMAAGGNPFAGNLYFGEYLDLPPLTEVVEKAPRLLGLTLTPFEEGLRRGFEWYRSQPRRAVDSAFEDRLLGTSTR